MVEDKVAIRVIYADTDAMGVVYHANYIKWFEIGRTELLRNMGYPYSEMERAGIMLPVVECNCLYRAPAIYDDLLEITTRIAKVKAATIILEYEIYRQGTGELLVTGMTKHAITDTRFKPVALKLINQSLYEAIKA